MRIGDAVVSQVHANVIVNEGTGNAEEVMKLIERMRQRVKAVHSIELQEEVRLVSSSPASIALDSADVNETMTER